MYRFGSPLRRAFARVLVVACAALAGAAAPALAVTTGYQGPSYGTLADSPTGTKPESKLWFNAGQWWASMLDQTSGGHHIFRLDRTTHQWVDTGVALDPRPTSHADTLWDAASNKLYVASNDFDQSPTTSSNSGRLWRFSYDALGNTYTLDIGFPAAINHATSETLTIAKDSTGKLWATWVHGKQVKVTHTTTDDATWAAPYVLPVAGIDVSADDISSVIAFGATKVGVMWGNQVDGQFHFAVHNDGGGDGAADWSAAAIPNPKSTALADDHINMKTDSSGRVYAVVKHNTSTTGEPHASLLVRAVDGSFTWHTVSTLPEPATRPILLLDEAHSRIRVYLTNSTSGGRIYEKTSAMDTISFPGGLGTAVLRDDAASLNMNNATSTKQNTTAASGIVVLASDDSTRTYWHAELAPATVSAPTAWFDYSPTQPTAGQAISLTSTSTDPDGDIASQSWDLNYDGVYGDATGTRATTSFTAPGPHVVRLRVTDSGGRVGNASRTINVVAPPPVSELAFTPAADAYVKSNSATSKYGTATTLRVRKDSSTGTTYRSYLRFVVTGITGQVTGVKLRLNVTDASKNGGDVFLLPAAANGWTETALTWKTAPALPATPRIGTAGAVAAGVINIDLGTAITADGTYTLALAGGGTDSAYYSSREASAATAPRLLVTQRG